jgi:hypothetical protein
VLVSLDMPMLQLETTKDYAGDRPAAYFNSSSYPDPSSSSSTCESQQLPTQPLNSNDPDTNEEMRTILTSKRLLSIDQGPTKDNTPPAKRSRINDPVIKSRLVDSGQSRCNRLIIDLSSGNIYFYKSPDADDIGEIHIPREIIDVIFEYLDADSITKMFVDNGNLLRSEEGVKVRMGEKGLKQVLADRKVPIEALAVDNTPGLNPYRVLCAVDSEGAGCQSCDKHDRLKHGTWFYCRRICDECSKFENMIKVSR